MCSGSNTEVSSTEGVMENELRKKDLAGDLPTTLMLLELSATDDLNTFKHAVEEEGHDIDKLGLWYGRSVGLKKMGFEERTPLMVAAMFGSKDIVTYILQTGQVDVNRASGSDGATALHCAAAGGSLYSHEVIKLLLESGGDVNRVDSNGNRPFDVISPCLSSSSRLKRNTLDNLLKKEGVNPTEEERLSSPKSSNDSPRSEKKEYPVDPSLPDIKNGIYGTDEFRMYTFKVKPCSRAYSHDWTECPFVHPGENAKRRDPRKYHYSCVPCPEFRKGACPKGDACEYAHGIFECWLHPAQYRTRLCKDETNCPRRVCFFAHKPEELRPMYASTGSAVLSPRSYSSCAPSFDMGSFSPLGGASGGSSSIGGAAAWQNHLNIMPPPALLLPNSRLKAALNARDMDFEAEFRRQQLLDEFAGLTMSSPTSWTGFSREMGRLSGSHFSMEPCGSPVSNARLASFANRSQSFIDRSTVNRLPDRTPSHLSDWGSPDGKVEWGVHGDELNKFRKSASFGFRTNAVAQNRRDEPEPEPEPEPDVSWVQSLVKDGQPITSAKLSFEEQLKQQYYRNNGGSGRIPPWAEQEPMVA